MCRHNDCQRADETAVARSDLDPFGDRQQVQSPDHGVVLIGGRDLDLPTRPSFLVRDKAS